MAPLDAKTRTWAARVVVRPSQVEEIINSRGRALQLLANLSRSVSVAAINELITVAERAAAGEAHSILEAEAQRFHDDVERLAERLSEVAGGVRRPFPGETCSAVLAALDVARRTSDDKRAELHQRILSLGLVLERLGGRAKPIPSPLTVPEAQRLVNAELDAVIILLGEAWDRVRERLGKLGFDDQFGQRVEGATPEDDLVHAQSASDWCSLVEQEASALVAMGASIPQLAPKSREGVLQELRAEVGRWRKQLQDVNETVRLIRLRLMRLGCLEVDGEPSLFADVKEATDNLNRLNAELERVRHKRLMEASDRAQGAYKILLSDAAPEDSEVTPFRELRKLGLIRTIEDEL